MSKSLEYAQYRRIATNYERKVLRTFLQKETKANKALHRDIRSLWVRSCDAISDLKREVSRLASRPVESNNNTTRVGRKTLGKVN